MKIRSVLLASGSAGVVTLGLVSITVLLDILLDIYLSPLLTLGFCFGLPIQVCIGGVFGAWFYRRLEESVTVGQGAVVGGLGGLLAFVLPIFLFILFWIGWYLIGVALFLWAGIPLNQAIEIVQTIVREMDRLMAQDTDFGVFEVVIGIAFLAGLTASLGTVGGVIGAAIFLKPATTASEGASDKAAAHPAESPPADRARRSGA